MIISYFCSVSCRFVDKKKTKWHQILVTVDAVQIAQDKAKVYKILLINYLPISKGMRIDDNIYLHNIEQLHREIGKHKIISKCRVHE